MSVYKIPGSFLSSPVSVGVVGAGGTGSVLLAGLAQMATALTALGHPGLEVTVYDDDVVTQANIGRQAFAQCDVGLPKARVLVNRINQTFGLKWKAEVHRLAIKDGTEDPFARQELHEIWIGCVDTRVARATIHQYWKRSCDGQNDASLWLDCGNTASAGQVILGALHEVTYRKPGRVDGKWDPGFSRVEVALPSAADLFPEMIDTALDATDDMPSCSLPEALAKQDLFTNRLIADTAMNLLWRLFRHSEIESHGAFVNLQTMRTNPLPVDPEGWERLGWKPPAYEEDPRESATADATAD